MEKTPIVPRSDENADGLRRRPNKLAAAPDGITAEEAVEHLGLGRFQAKLFLICGLFSATDALEMLLLSVLSPELRCDWKLSDSQVAWMTTIVFVGMFAGSGLWGMFADKYGRWPICFLAAAWIGYFGIAASFSPRYEWFLILRGLVGFAFGGAVQSFTLVSEYIPAKHRARVLIVSGVYWAAGSCFEVLLAYFILPTLGWRYLVAFSALPMVITLCFLWTLPESLRYLIAAGQQEKAMKTLKKACATNRVKMIEGHLVKSGEVTRGKFIDLFRGGYARTTIQLWMLWFGTACSYYGVVLLSSEIFEHHKVCGALPSTLDETPMEDKCPCNLLQEDDYKSMIISTFGEFCAIPIQLIALDLIGRRWSIALNFLGAGTFFFLIQMCTTRTVLTVFMFGVRAFTSSIFTCVYIYTGEVYPTIMRSLGLGSSSAMARVGAMLTPFLAQVLLHKSVTATVCLYGGLCFFLGLVAILLPIETKGREMPQTVK